MVPPYDFRIHPNHFIQWFVWNDTFHAIDSLDRTSEVHYKSEWVSDFIEEPSIEYSNSNVVVVSEDVDDITFCAFLNTCRFPVVKLNYRHPKCGIPYTHVRNPTKADKQAWLKRTRFGVILSVRDSIPPDFYTLAAMRKPIYTNNSIIHSLYKCSDLHPLIGTDSGHTWGTLYEMNMNNTYIRRITDMLYLFRAKIFKLHIVQWGF